jgi:F-type H+-transporting ATPase subunit delta
MKLSKQSRRDAKQLFRGTMVDGVMNEDRVRKTVTEILAKKPRGYNAILSHFQRLLKLETDRRSARIESAVRLSDGEFAAIKQNLEARYGKGLSVSFWLNPDLIGGLRIKVGSDVYDGSVQGRLKALEQSF